VVGTHYTRPKRPLNDYTGAHWPETATGQKVVTPEVEKRPVRMITA
jgi:hypothetical protein